MEEEEDENPLVSPRRPHQSPSASPQALLRPDPPLPDEVLNQVSEALRSLPEPDNGEVGEVGAVGEELPEVAAMVDFDAENKEDGEKSQDYARSIKVDFNKQDIVYWFSELEGEMEMASVGSQWLKRTILQRNLPQKQKEDVKAYLSLPKSGAGEDIYLKIKNELVRIYAPKPSESYKRALTRQMVGLPSQLGMQIMNDVCKKATKLDGCCCDGAVLALWSLQLPSNIRAHISGKVFNKNTYKQVFQDADEVYLSSKQVTVAALMSESSRGASALDETLPAFSQQNQPQVAAVSSNKGSNSNSGSGNGGKNKKNKNKNQNQSRGQKHNSVPDNLAEKMCDRHYRHGAGAWYCLQPSSCPWASKTTSKQQ